MILYKNERKMNLMNQKKIDADFYYNLKQSPFPKQQCVLHLNKIESYETDLSIKYGFITINRAIARLTQYVSQTRLNEHTYNTLAKRIENLQCLPPNSIIDDTHLFDIHKQVRRLTIEEVINETQLTNSSH